MRAIYSIALTSFIASTLSAQMPGMDNMAGMHHHDAPTVLSAKAKKQIDSVAKAVTKYGTEKAAADAGFQPKFGWIPTMGEHWVAVGQMMNGGRQTNRNAPSQLMFSKIAGKDSLVGAAYGYLTATNDTVRPVLFDGAPSWHEHPDLAPEGLTLVMLHVWFVPSPDGPFAGTNPNLPFWALGLAAPDSAKMHDKEFSDRVRKASLALAEVVDTTAILPTLARRPDVRPALMARRDSVSALIPEFKAAEKAKDAARWDRVAAKTAAQWDGMYATYIASTRTKAGRDRVEQFVAMMLGKHGE